MGNATMRNNVSRNRMARNASAQSKKAQSMIQQNVIEQNTIERNAIKQNTIEQNTIERNAIKQNTIEQNAIKQNAIEQNEIMQDAAEQNTAKHKAMEPDMLVQNTVERDMDMLVQNTAAPDMDMKNVVGRMPFSSIRAADEAPYPPVQVERKNRRYAYAMLGNMSGRHSELSTITQYVYNGFVTKGFLEKEDAALIFHEISIVEMHHLSIFGQLACLLGADPRFWSLEQGQRGFSRRFSGGSGRMRYWNAGYNFYSTDFLRLLKRAIEGEQQAIRNYQKQCQWIKDEHVRENLQRIIKDEELHVRILNEMYLKCI